MDTVLRITDLTRRFGTVAANDSISLTAHAGQVLGLLGHNGAGKTTLVSQVVGLLRPGSGSIDLAGTDAVAHPAQARRHTAIQPQAQAPIDGLTPRLAIELSGRIRGLTPRAARDRAEQIAAEIDIGEWLDRRALPEGGGLSGGVRRLTAFAMALVAPTPLLVLDEPTNDIDAARRKLLWDAVRRRGDQGAAVLLVTHNVNEAERVVDDLVVLHHGRVVGAGSPAQLRGAHGDDLRLELVLAAGAAAPDQGPPGIMVRRRVHSGRRLLLTIPAPAAAESVRWAQELTDTDRIEGFSLGPATLEDAYLALTTDTEPDQDVDPSNTAEEQAHV